jgi:hypothetical protein
MTEDYLHYIWQYRLFNRPELKTTTGLPLVIIQPGLHNTHGGPDFLNARLKIGTEVWSGHVEIHIRSSDWHRHGHTNDDHYKNVILHAVYTNDEEIYLHHPGDLPIFHLGEYIIGNQWEKYQQWLKNKTWVPCESRIAEVDLLTWRSWKDRLLVERLEEKSNAFLIQYEKTAGDWSETFYRKLARNFGFKVNADAMERLAESLPLSVLARHKSDPFQIEALLFGQAGFLQEIFADEYPNDLQKEFLFLSHKYGLKPMNVSTWNFGRLRPTNFPTIRIAQLAALVCESDHLFSKIIETEELNSIFELFEIEPHVYWLHHFRFDTRMNAADANAEGKNRINTTSRKPGKDSVQNILINTVAVGLFTYGKYNQNQKQIDKALKLLEICDSEENVILRKWAGLGQICKNASDSQSMIQLYNVYCSARKCLQCQVGLKLLKQQ